MNLATRLGELARERPQQTAIVEGRKRISFSELEQKACQRADGLLAEQLGEGDRLLLGLGMSISLYVELFALWKIGAVPLFIDPGMPASTLQGLLEELAPLNMRAGNLGHLWRLKSRQIRSLPLSKKWGDSDQVPAVDLPDEHPALLTFTSGSTGLPKGVCRSHDFLWRQHLILETCLEARPGATALATLPVFALSHLAAGMCVWIAPGLLRGAGKVSASAIRKGILREQPDVAVAAPAFYEQLCAAGKDLPGLRRAFVGGGPVHPYLMRRMQALLPDGEVVAVYGSSEAEPIAELPFAELSDDDLAALREGQGLPAGVPVESIELRFREGEIQVSGPQVLSGYWKGRGDAENKLHEDGRIWHRSGDAGELDEQGRLWLKGRMSGRVGELQPFAVEAAAVERAKLRLAALVEFQDQAWLAVQELRGQPSDEAALDQVCQQFGLAGWRRMTLPVDKRHQSKVDLPRLTKRFAQEM